MRMQVPPDVPILDTNSKTNPRMEKRMVSSFLYVSGRQAMQRPPNPPYVGALPT